MAEVWTVVEDQATPVPGFQVDWLPDSAFKYLTPLVRGSRVSLDVGPYSGLIPLRSGATLRVEPKIGPRAFGRMVFVSEGLDTATRREFEEFVNLGADDSGQTPWTRVLARSFAGQLRSIEKRSLAPRRVSTLRRLQHARGRLLPEKTALSLARRDSHPVHAVLRNKTYDTAEHSVLSLAAERVMASAVDVDAGSARILAAWANRLKNASVSRSDLESVVRGLNRRLYAGPRAYYAPALTMAQLILAGAGISLESAVQVAGDAVLVETSTVYEQYLRSILSRSFTNEGYIIRKGVSPALTLFTDGQCETIPDIVVLDDQRPRLILDAKYKLYESISSSDAYQMYSYMSVLGLRRGAVVSLAPKGKSDVRRQITFDGKEIFHVRLDIENWRTTEAWLAGVVRQIL